MRSTRGSSLLFAAAAAMLGAGVAPAAQHMADRPDTRIVQRVSKRQALRNARGPMLYGLRVTSTRTVAQNKRAAIKRRNRARAK